MREPVVIRRFSHTSCGALEADGQVGCCSPFPKCVSWKEKTMSRVWIGFAASLALLAGVQGASPASSGVPVNDAEARLIVGGAEDCGNKWKAGSVSCPSGTVLCGSNAVECSTISHSTLVTNGAGDQVEGGSDDPTCLVCTNAICSRATIVTSTSKAKCDDE